MADILLLATENGLVVAERDPSEGDTTTWRVAWQGLSGKPLTSVVAREGVILAGARRDLAF